MDLVSVVLPLLEEQVNLAAGGQQDLLQINTQHYLLDAQCHLLLENALARLQDSM